MGILSENLVWLLKSVPAPCSMLELGNQFLYICAKPFESYPTAYLNPTMAAHVAAKPYLKSIGYEHTSIDLNGCDGALKLDLSAHVDLGCTFDVATDFGTSEHVPCLWKCLENVHRHVKIGGKMLHVNPLAGNWPGHGNWYRDEEFYEAYSKITGYRLVESHRTAACHNTTDGWNIAVILEKSSDSTFPGKEDFYRLPIKRK